MAGRPSKPAEMILLEGKSHRTKEEIESRKKLEAMMYTKKHMKVWPEVKADPVASKEFARVKNLLKIIGKDDALHEGIVNRYAMLKSECQGFEEKREGFYRAKSELEEEYRSGEAREKEDGDGGLTPSQYYKLLSDMMKSIIELDRQIMAKRKMMLDIEKESLLTIASALRSIPKKPPREEKKSGMAAFMAGREAK